ncbi:glucan endo-1,3-beta-glucosidase 2 [Argentina anserina]|uniref:glucan endo-1,3-beta-glucosidase 2 n=1 Tax=Argentina anserina TaxID=57926 RepID=UPI002176710E|nr:glucan endo-1,3-beta-glucosidase 2 [Potentilla anserina]
MASHFSLSAVSLITLLSLLLLLSPTAAAPSPDTFSTVIGATYSASTAATYPAPLTPEHLASAVASLNLAALRLDVSDPGIVRAFLYSNTTLILTIPNALVPPLAANRSNAMRWLYAHVVPFFPRTKIAAISVGNDLLESAPEFSQFLLPAIQNVHLALLDIGIHKIAVSTTFSFVNVITTPFPPSAAQFQDAPLQTVVRPLLQFLRGTNSSFFVNLYPYNLYRLRSEIPIGFPLFQDHPFGFRDDMTTGVRYRNLFDMMVDAVISAMAVAGHENIPIVVTETGWPSCSTDPREVEANPVYAELYLNGLLGHLKSGRGTPLRKEGLPQVFIYELIDKQVRQGRQWGILFPNMTKKYKNVDFRSDSDGLLGGFSFLKVVLGQLLVFAFLLNQW